METVRRRGRPRSAAPMPAAERMRRYRARLRSRGLRRVETQRRDPLLAALRFAPESLLTPGEQEVLRRFCAGLQALPELPEVLVVFGSRVQGGADERSDLDLAVVFGGARDAALEAALADIALEARRPYCAGDYGIYLRPVALFSRERGSQPLARAIAREGEAIWRRPR